MSQGSSRFASSQNISAAVCDAFLNKEGTHRGPIAENKALCEAAAPRLRKEVGEVEDRLLSMVRYVDDESILSTETVQNFLQQARGHLKRIAEMNIENDRNISVYMEAVKTLKQAEVANFDTEGAEEKEIEDPGEHLKQIYAQKKTQMEQLNLDMSEEKHYRDVCEQMGEKIGKADEDEIEVQYNAASQRNLLMCPIMGTLMENPVKNKACGHLYSRDGIESHIQSMRRSRRQCSCPVTGCSNGNVTLDQLETDLRAQNMIRREQRRMDREKEVFMSQADSVELDDGE